MLEAREGDLEIVLRATVDGDRLTLDFTGTAPQHDGNLNCPLAVTRSACYFAIRVLTDPDIPPSAGAYRPVEVIAPEGCLLNARSPAAVVGGNVETSSRVADVVLRAFGRALGQGTMNNVTLGTEDVVYYETIGGGQGACPDADGPSGVHVAMSNTLNTPIEALELEFPLRMIEYALRRGSGGAGEFHGGDGVIRELEALAPLSYSLITERRRHAPPGAAGGGDGAPGRNLLDGRSCRRRRSASSSAGSGCGSRPRAAAATAGRAERDRGRVNRRPARGRGASGELSALAAAASGVRYPDEMFDIRFGSAPDRIGVVSDAARPHVSIRTPPPRVDAGNRADSHTPPKTCATPARLRPGTRR